MVSSLVWLWWVIDLSRFEFKSGTFQLFYLYLCFLFEESYLFISLCAGGRCGMTDSNEDHGRSRRLSAEDRWWSSTDRILGGQMIERSGDTVCSLYHAWGDEEHVFLGGISKPKINRLSVVWLQNHWDSLCLNITATTSYFGSQNQASYGLSVAP
jgi:hypothetical protein